MTHGFYRNISVFSGILFNGVDVDSMIGIFLSKKCYTCSPMNNVSYNIVCGKIRSGKRLELLWRLLKICMNRFVRRTKNRTKRLNIIM